MGQSILSNLNCSNAMTWHVFVSLHQFRVIVGLSILRHSINLETFYQFWDIVSILRHCIHFEILYSYRDIDPRHHIHFKKAHTSLFSLAIEKKQRKKKIFPYLTLKTDP